MDDLLIPVSFGELLDKITILEIKAAAISDTAKQEVVARELSALQTIRSRHLSETPELLNQLMGRLKAVNTKLWDIEDAIRLCEVRKDFGGEFIRLARAVYKTNDKRAAIKGEIDMLLGSPIREVKSYATLTEV